MTLEDVKRMYEEGKLFDEVMELFAECTDVEVNDYFDINSEKMLSLKKTVLTRLNAGESPEKIGDGYYKILELMPDDMKK